MGRSMGKMRKVSGYYDAAVIFGGVSSENEVSVITGTMVCNVLKKGGKTVLPVYISHGGDIFSGEGLEDVTVYKGDGWSQFYNCAFCTGGFVLLSGKKVKQTVKVGCVLNCCHGGAGEGGGVAGACDLFRLPSGSAGIAESAVFMDKYLTKLMLKGLGANTAKYAYSRDIAGAIEGARTVGYPVIVKPATLGSSIGIVKCDDEESLKNALYTAFELDGGVLIEEYFTDRREINCAVYFRNGQAIASLCEEVSSGGELLSYDDKYCGGGTRKFPAELETELAESIRNETVRIYSALNMRGIVRFDYILSGGRAYVSEINTVPGSLSQYLLSDSYKSFYGVLADIIEQARRDFAEKCGKRVISTGILKSIRPSAKLK